MRRYIPIPWLISASRQKAKDNQLIKDRQDKIESAFMAKEDEGNICYWDVVNGDIVHQY